MFHACRVLRLGLTTLSLRQGSVVSDKTSTQMKTFPSENKEMHIAVEKQTFAD